VKLLLLLAALLASCADDGADPPAAAVTTDCPDCRTVAAGSGFQDGETAVGVTRCDGGTCEVSIAAPDGTETELDVGAGDVLDVGAGWAVVATGAAGLTIRPA
jgi:hypothetical protein